MAASRRVGGGGRDLRVRLHWAAGRPLLDITWDENVAPHATSADAVV